MLVFDPARLKARLAPLAPWRTLAFGALLFERMLPNYFEFQQQTEHPGGQTLRAVRANIWEVLETGNFTVSGFPTEGALEAATPDTEAHSSEYTSAALDAAVAAANLVAFVRTQSVDLIVENASLMHDTFYVFVGNRTDHLDQMSDEFDETVRSNAMLLDELQAQLSDAEFVKSMGSWPEARERIEGKGYGRLRLR